MKYEYMFQEVWSEFLIGFIGRCHRNAKSDYQLPHVRPSAYNSTSTGQIFMKFDILEFFVSPSRKLKFR
jgi:hypothetical protein